MNDTRVLRYEVPVDGKWHGIRLPDRPILHVASRRPDVVEFWVEESGGLAWEHWFQVFGTGQPGVHGTYVGTAIIPGGALVWHLYEEADTVIGVRGEARGE